MAWAMPSKSTCLSSSASRAWLLRVLPDAFLFPSLSEDIQDMLSFIFEPGIVLKCFHQDQAVLKSSSRNHQGHLLHVQMKVHHWKTSPILPVALKFYPTGQLFLPAIAVLELCIGEQAFFFPHWSQAWIIKQSIFLKQLKALSDHKVPDRIRGKIRSYNHPEHQKRKKKHEISNTLDHSLAFAVRAVYTSKCHCFLCPKY